MIEMAEAPSLFCLCIKAISEQIIEGFDHAEEVLELPSGVLDELLMEMSAVALHSLHELSLDSYCGRESTTNSIHDGRKRGRYDGFDVAWENLYKKRWPRTLTKMQQPPSSVGRQDGLGMSKVGDHKHDWQQLYWEAHLRICLDEAAERALLPASNGDIGGIQLSDSIMKSIGYTGDTPQNCASLSYHCNKFGRYARCLRLQNVLCVAEICELLRDSKLEALAFRRIIWPSHVDGVCMLLNCNKDSLLSIEFVFCQLLPASVNQICNSVYIDDIKGHGIQNLCIKSSSIFECKSSSLPAGLSSFLSSGWSLKSITLCNTHMGPQFAKIIFDTLLKSSSGLVNLEISDNEIAGWLSKVDRNSVGFLLLSGKDTLLKSLRVLNLRGNNLQKDDMKDICNVLMQMPNLTSIDISDNPIEDDGIRNLIPYFSKALEEAHPISDIKIENCNISLTGMGEFLGSLSMSNISLNSLSIADNDLGCSIAAILAQFLGNSRVKVLNIEDIGLGPLGFQELENKMPKNVELVHINISKNRGGIRAAHFVSTLILRAAKLLSVDAGYNLMPHESLDLIHRALTQSKGKLERLDLTGNTSLHVAGQRSAILDFKSRGEPIVTVDSFPSLSNPYDDDP